VTFSIDSNGIVSVKAQDLGTGKEQNIRVKSSSGLTGGEIDRIVQEAEKQAGVDAQAKELAEAKNELEALVFTSEKSVNEFENELASEIVEKVSVAIAQAKKAMHSTDVQEVRQAKSDLNEAAHSLAEQIYGQIASSEE